MRIFARTQACIYIPYPIYVYNYIDCWDPINQAGDTVKTCTNIRLANNFLGKRDHRGVTLNILSKKLPNQILNPHVIPSPRLHTYPATFSSMETST